MAVLKGYPQCEYVLRFIGWAPRIDSVQLASVRISCQEHIVRALSQLVYLASQT